MKHVLVAENQRQGLSHLQEMGDYHFDILGLKSSGISVRLPHGRVDEILIIYNENHILGHRFVGRVFRATNSITTDDLWAFCARYVRERNGLAHSDDNFTQQFPISTVDYYISYLVNPEASCWDIALNSVSKWND